MRLWRRACSAGGMMKKFSDRAIHLRLWASPSERQVPESGARAACWAGVSVVQVGKASARGAGAVRTWLARIGAWVDTEGFGDWATVAVAGAGTRAGTGATGMSAAQASPAAS